jgi:AcrR family transcriptional regulator
MKLTKKEEIANSAIDLIYENGYQETKVEDITKKAGVAKGTFYTYFKTKEELLVYILEEAIEQYIQYGEKYICSSEMLRDNLKGYVKKELECAIENQKLFSIIIGMILNDVKIGMEIKKMIQTEEKKGFRKIKEMLKKGQENGELKDYSQERLDALSVLISHMLKFHMGKVFLEMPNDTDFTNRPSLKKGKIKVDLEQESEFIVDMILYGIAK